MAAAMDVDVDEVEVPSSSSSKGEKKRFEVKKVSLVNITSFFMMILIFSVERCGFMGLGYCKQAFYT